eukprot:768059-Hanusia_phi.AAC.1
MSFGSIAGQRLPQAAERLLQRNGNVKDMAEGEAVSEVPMEMVEENFKAFYNKKLGEGVISTEDVGMFLRSLNCNPSIKEIQQVCQICDPNGEGSIRLAPMIPLLAKLMAKPVSENHIKGKGLSIDEMRKILSSYGEKLPPEEIDEFLALMEDKCCLDQEGQKSKFISPELFSVLVLPKQDT